jgi:hypothetical protein
MAAAYKSTVSRYPEDHDLQNKRFSAQIRVLKFMKIG